MGDDVSKAQQVTPAEYVGLVNRLLQLPAGVHTVIIIKTARGKEGLVGWGVGAPVKLERPTPPGGGARSGEAAKKLDPH